MFRGMGKQMLKGMPDLQYPSVATTKSNLGKLYKSCGAVLYNDYVATQSNPFLSGTKWNRCCSHPNGKVYFAPFTVSTVLVFDPDTDSYTAIASPQLGYVGAVCVGRKIYFTPYTNTLMLIYDPDENKFTTVQIATTNALLGEGIANPDGKIYMTPLTGSGFGIFDTRDNSFKKLFISSYIPGVSSDNAQGNAMIGYTYYALSTTGTYRMWMIDTRTDEYMYDVGNIPNLGTYVGMDVGKDGNLYAAPLSGTTGFLKFDVVKNKFSLIPGTQTGYIGAVRNIDGNIVGIPHSVGFWSLLDVTNQIVYYRAYTGATGSSYAGGCLDKYGRVIACPHTSQWYLHIGSKCNGELGYNLYGNHNWSNISEKRYHKT